MEKRFRTQINQMEELLSSNVLELNTPEVSGWSVGQQLDHVLKSGCAVIERLLNSQADAPGGINIIGRIVLLTGRIPRGRGKAPAGLEGEALPFDEVVKKLSRFKLLITHLEKRSDLLKSTAPHSRHPYFGSLSPKQWVKFLYIHNKHHLLIISDIRAKH